MSAADAVIRGALESDEQWRRILKLVIQEELNMTAAEFSTQSGIPVSTLYKLLSGKRKPTLKTLRDIVKTIQKIEEGRSSEFIAVIAARPVLNHLIEKKLKVEGRLVTVREYSATSMEEAIVAAVRAEREGARALVCAPIVSTTIEKVVRIPVATIMPRRSLLAAIEVAARKMG